MGEMIYLGDYFSSRTDQLPLRHDGRWMFLDWTGTIKKSEIDVTKTFPYPVYFHQDSLGLHRGDKAENRQLRVAIRRWIDRNISGPVMYDLINMTYYRVYKMSRPIEDRYMSAIEHGYYAFYFEQENDAFAFRLAFAEVETTMKPHHPNYQPYADSEDFKNAWEAQGHAPMRGYI